MFRPMTRRQFLAIGGVSTGAAVLAGCSNTTDQKSASKAEEPAVEHTEVMSVAAGPAYDLKVNGLTDPVGIPMGEAPRFSWKIDSDETGAKQKSYQIKVTDDAGTTVWDSGVQEKSDSQDIAYEGDALVPRGRYAWTVTVPDKDGKELQSEEATFICGLADGTMGAWEGAKWIGSSKLYFDATVMNYFSFDATLTIADGTDTAGIVLGANDFRLANDAMNIWGSKTTSSFVYAINVSDPKAPKLEIFVHGMPAFEAENDGDETKPAYTIAIDSKVLSDAHKPIQINVNTLSNVNSVTCLINGEVVDENRQINPLGNTHDYNTFPNLDEIGFFVASGGSATYTDVCVRYPGQYEETYEVGDFFSATAGATYKIFEGLEGVTVKDDEITVKADGSDVLAFADPSFGSAPMVRSEFELKGEVKYATLFMSAQGIAEVYLNGMTATLGYFNPGNAEYATNMCYRAFDVTGWVDAGKNAIGAQLAEGWWSGYQSYTVTNWGYYGAKQALLALLDVTYADGSTETIVTSPDTWTVFDNGPVRAASFFHGERYDATIEAKLEGWTEADFDEPAWEQATEITPRQNDFTFCERLDNVIAAYDLVQAQSCLGETKPGTSAFIYDMGENLTGIPQIAIPDNMAKPGETLIIRYAEVLYPDLEEYREAGTVNQMMVENLRAAMVTDFYTMGEGEQVFEPQFTYRGYRYIEICGLDQELPLENVCKIPISSITATSTYSGSNDLVNRLFKNVLNSQQNNFVSLPLDCPQRNERLGWTGDAQVFSLAAAYNADVYNFYRDWMRSLVAEQHTDGSLPVYAPTFEPHADSKGFGFEGISWDAALMIIPYNMYQMTGNSLIISDSIDAIEKYLKFLQDHPMILPEGDDPMVGEEVPELTSETGFLADWLAVEETDPNLINNAVYVYLLGISAEMAGVVGKADLQKKWQEMHDASKAKWNEIYFDAGQGVTVAPAGKVFDTITFSGYIVSEGGVQDTEASYATPLAYDVFSDENKEAAAAALAKCVERANYTITSGFSGTPFLVPMLTKYGYVDEAYKLFEQEDYASWLYPVVNGATSVWERWNSFTVEGGFNGNNSMNSFDHFSLGAITQWMMEYQLGIARDEAGFAHFMLQPTPGGTFTNCSGTYESPYGTIGVSWNAAEGKLTSYMVTVPANTQATLYLPIEADVAEALELPEGVVYTGMNQHDASERATFELPAGTFEFTL